MDGWMDGWMGGWINEWMDGYRIDRWMGGGWTDSRLINGKIINRGVCHFTGGRST